MFNSIKGVIVQKLPKQLILENNGIEWDICVPDSNLDQIGHTGSEAKIYTWLQHTDMVMCLYGFSSAEERSVFLDLLKVDGLGPKGALKIMSSVTSSQLLETLESGEVGLLEKIPGVGKKTAGKMMLALKGKLSLSENTQTITIQKNNEYNDVIESLVSMGYDRKTVELKVSELSARYKSEIDGKSQKEKEDLLFRRAIVELA